MLSFNLSQLNEGALVESCDPVMLVVWFDGVFVVVVVICVVWGGARVLASCTCFPCALELSRGSGSIGTEFMHVEIVTQVSVSKVPQEALFRNVRCAQCHSLKALPVLNTNRVLFSIHISI